MIWIDEVFNNLEVRNNYILARTTTTPRQEGPLGLNPYKDFNTIFIFYSAIECHGQTRPLFRNLENYGAVVQNNMLTNVSDASKLNNAKADRAAGLEKSLQFACGVDGEFTVKGWKAGPSKKSAEVRPIEH